jgi:hypothetical protein
MDIDKAHGLIEKELVGWSATRILAFDNVRTKFVPVKSESWANFIIHWMPSENMALGTKVTKNGIASLQIFSPFNSGPRVVAKIADYYFGLLENKVIGDSIFTYAGELVRIGNVTDWYKSSANVPFKAI